MWECGKRERFPRSGGKPGFGFPPPRHCHDPPGTSRSAVPSKSIQRRSNTGEWSQFARPAFFASGTCGSATSGSRLRRCCRCPSNRRAWLQCLHRKLTIELGAIALAQKLVGRFQCSDARDPKLPRQPALPGTEAPFAASARLRRVGRNHPRAPFFQRPPT